MNSGISFWEQNLTLLRTRYPELAEQLENYEATRSNTGDAAAIFCLEQTPAGSPTLICCEKPGSPGISIHSRRDPAREGQRWAETALAESPPAEAAGILIMLGFGLGYTADTLSETGHTLIIVERRMELFRLALESRDLEKVLKPGKALFIIGGEAGGITAALSLLEKTILSGAEKKPLVIKNRALCTLTTKDEEWYAETERRITTWASKDKINAATLQRFGRRWTRNLAANMKGVLRFPGVKNLENILENVNIPVLLAAAGPSLDRITPHLEEIRRRCVIVAVDTSLRFLLRQGIDPDFTVSVDPQYWNALHLHHCTAPRTALIAESAVFPSVLRNSSFGRIFFCQSLFPLGRFIEDRTDPKGPLGAGGSVATTAWDFARLLHPSAVWIAGLDLSFPGLQTHFKGALFEDRINSFSERFRPAENSSVEVLENGVPFYAPSIKGGKVLTDRRLSLYAAWFENRLSQTGLKNYNLSSGGLTVPGCIAAEPEEILALPPCRDRLDRILEDVYRRIDDHHSQTQENRYRQYTRAYDCLIRGLEEIRNYAAEAASEAKKFLTAESAFSTQKNKAERVLEKLDKANKAIAESPVKDAAGFLFPAIAELEKELRETDSFRRHLEFSLLLYRSLSEAVDFTLACFLKNDS